MRLIPLISFCQKPLYCFISVAQQAAKTPGDLLLDLFQSPLCHAQTAFIEKGMIFHVMYTLRLYGEKSEYDCLHR
jgi:hypothetical protein